MILEMRTYVLKPGMTQNFVERFAEGLTARLQFSKLLGLWQSEVGGLNRVVHVWPYDSFEERERIAGEARKTGKWPPKTQEFIITQENKIIQPAPFSPPLPERKLGELYEFRTYTYQPGAMPTVLLTQQTNAQNQVGGPFLNSMPTLPAGWGGSGTSYKYTTTAAGTFVICGTGDSTGADSNGGAPLACP